MLSSAFQNISGVNGYLDTLSHPKASWCITSVLSISELLMSLWKWMRHGRRWCISAYLWGGVLVWRCHLHYVVGHSHTLWATKNKTAPWFSHHYVTLLGWLAEFDSQLTDQKGLGSDHRRWGRFKQCGLRGFLVWGGGSTSIWCIGHWKHGQGAQCSGYPLLEAIWGSSVAENMQPLWIRWVFRDLL